MIEDAPQQVSPPLNRMIIAVLALIGVFISLYLTLHKYGVIGSLACGAGSCDTVQSSKWAVFMGVPVPVLGLAGYAVVLLTALVGLARIESRTISVLLVVLATGALAFTVYLTYLEAFVIHAWCRWCIASAAIAALIWIASLAELPRMRRAT